MSRIAATRPLVSLRSFAATARRAGAAFRLEVGPLLALAWPVIAAEIGWVTMWLVDTLMVGRVGAEAIGAVSVGGHLFFVVAIFGVGMLLGLDYLVAHACGAGDLRSAHRALLHGLYLALGLAAALTALLRAALPFLGALGIQEAVLAQAGPYLEASTWSLLPLLVFTALRRYLQALGLVKPVMVALVSANFVNAAADWVLIFGRLGAPALGAAGAGWATCCSRVYMALVLVAYVACRERRRPSGLARVPLRPDAEVVRRLVGLGLPAALQTTFEVGVFTVATALAATLAPTALAAHQIALSAAAFTFMVPLGVSSAGAVRVGRALGGGDRRGAGRSGWTALTVGGGVMLAAAAAFVLAPRAIVGAFTGDPAVLAVGTRLLLVAAVFQLFDGLQVVATGVLRGTGDTRTPMVANLVGYWMIGLPIGAALCFRLEWGVVGLWIGLCVGLIIVALVLVRVWAWRAAEVAGVTGAAYGPA